MKTRTNEPIFYLNLFQPCAHTHTAVGLGRGPWIEVNQKACPVWVKICSWWIRCPHEDDYFGQNARSVHSKNANRRFKVSQDFVPSTEGTIFGPWHYDCKPHHNETLFSLADLKKKKKLYVPAGGQGWTVRSPSNLDHHARHSCVAGRREREFQRCWLLLTWATVPTQTAVYELDSASKTHNIRCRTAWCGRASSCYMSSTMDGWSKPDSGWAFIRSEELLRGVFLSSSFQMRFVWNTLNYAPSIKPVFQQFILNVLQFFPTCELRLGVIIVLFGLTNSV